ncbi:MAG: hypothetical protein AB7P02_00330 [Alphaproteobacteria bacterium]
MIRWGGTAARGRLVVALLTTTLAGGAAAGEVVRHPVDPWSYLVAKHAPARHGQVEQGHAAHGQPDYGRGHQAQRHRGVQGALPALARPAPPNGEALAGDATISADLQQSVGCVIAGTGATALALAAGAENLVNVVSGGLVTSANPVVLYMGVVGVVFASFCSLGQALTPLYLYFTEPATPAATPPASPGSSQDVCVSCRRALHGGPIREASGPLSGDFVRVAATGADRVRAAAAAQPTSMRAALAELAGRRSRPAARPQSSSTPIEENGRSGGI